MTHSIFTILSQTEIEEHLMNTINVLYESDSEDVRDLFKLPFFEPFLKYVEDIVLQQSILSSFLTKEELSILNRNSHLDATHMGGLYNPALYMSLGGRDFCYEDQMWKLCKWPGSTINEFIEINKVIK